MAVSTTTNRIAYVGNGVTTVFSFPEYLTAATDLKVISRVIATGVETLLVLNTDYSLAFVGSQVNGAYPGGANITMLLGAPANTVDIVLYRDVPETQTTHLTDNDPFSSGTMEFTFDKIVLMVQRLMDLAARSIGLSDGFAGTFNPKLPGLIPPNCAIVTDNTGANFLLVPTASFTGIAGPAGPTGATGPAGAAGSSGAVVTPLSSTTALVVGSPINLQYVPCDATAAPFNANLPAANLAAVGQIFQIKKTDAGANAITIARNGADQILLNGLVTTLSLDYQGKSYTLICRAAGFWDVV